MYRTAQLFLELNKRSLRTSDKTEAMDLLKRIQGHYPKSAYTARARHLIKEISVQEKKTSFLQTENLP